MEFFDIVFVVPAEHHEDAKFLTHVWLHTAFPHCTDTIDSLFPIGASPTGEQPATHYFCHQRMNQVYLDANLDEWNNRTTKIFDWCYPDITDDKDIALTHMVIMKMALKDVLAHLGLKLCK